MFFSSLILTESKMFYQNCIFQTQLWGCFLFKLSRTQRFQGDLKKAHKTFRWKRNFSLNIPKVWTLSLYVKHIIQMSSTETLTGLNPLGVIFNDFSAQSDDITVIASRIFIFNFTRFWGWFASTRSFAKHKKESKGLRSKDLSSQFTSLDLEITHPGNFSSNRARLACVVRLVAPSYCLIIFSLSPK